MKITKHEILIGLLWILFIVLSLGANASEGDFAYRVKTEYGNGINHGTACAISAHTLVTAAHVVQGADEIFIDDEIGWLRCKVVKQDAETDIAILECKSVTLHFIPLDTAARHVGETVTLWSSVLGAKIKSIAGTLHSLWDKQAHGRWLCEAQGFDHGGSGSPVVIEHKLIGVATALNSEQSKQPVFVPAACVQVLIDGAPVIVTPETKAEIVELPTPAPKLNAVMIPTEFPKTAPVIQKTCSGGRCHLRASVHERSTAQKPCVAARRWDSDADGHGQGGWVSE